MLSHGIAPAARRHTSDSDGAAGAAAAEGRDVGGAAGVGCVGAGTGVGGYVNILSMPSLPSAGAGAGAAAAAAPAAAPPAPRLCPRQRCFMNDTSCRLGPAVTLIAPCGARCPVKPWARPVRSEYGVRPRNPLMRSVMPTQYGSLLQCRCAASSDG